jgi:hypothetical protein
MLGAALRWSAARYNQVLGRSVKPSQAASGASAGALARSAGARRHAAVVLCFCPEA